MLKIYCQYKTPRTSYLFNQLAGRFLLLPFDYVDEEYKPGANEFLIAYSNKTHPYADLHIFPSGLLHETNVFKKEIKIDGNGESTKLFVNTSQYFGFDIFAAIFYIITRYEEYLPFKSDEHNRFCSKNSIANKYNFIELPIIDFWINTLNDIVRLKVISPDLRKFEVINTIDIDNAFAYLGKSALRQTGALAKHLTKGQLKEIKQRVNVLQNTLVDPYDTYEYIREIHDLFNLNTIFFHLCGKLAKHDRNISISNKKYHELIKQLDNWAMQGLHPSYQSSSKINLISVEKRNLENTLGKKINKSRQHFLKVNFPETFERLINVQIDEDYSLGYADCTGFRAGTGKSFYFYNLKKEVETKLILQPFCIMDGTMKDYMKLSIPQAVEKVKQYKFILQKYKSTFVTLWHNETLSETKGWEGWRKVYEAQFN